MSRLFGIFSKQKLTYSNILKAIFYSWAATLCFPALQGTFYAVFAVLVWGVIKGELKFKSFKKKEDREKEKFSISKEWLPALSLSLYVLYMTSSFFWSNDIPEYFRQFEKLVPFYLLVVILIIDGLENHLNINKVLYAFLWGVLTATGYMVIRMGVDCFIGNTYHSIKINGLLGIGLFDYIQHYTYLGTTILMVIPLLIFKTKTTKGFLKISNLLFIVFICFLCFSSNSRIVMLLVLIVLLFSFYFIWGRFICLGWRLLITFCCIAIGVFFIAHSPKVENQLAQFIDSDRNIKEMEYRPELWVTAISLIKHKPFIGYGIGNQHDIFIEENFKRGNLFEANQGFNVHNQYLQTLLGGGLIGLIILLLFFGSIIRSQKEGVCYEFSFFVGCFMIIYGIGFITESMLMRNIGVLPIVFWCFIINKIKFEFQNSLEGYPVFMIVSSLVIFLFLIIIISISTLSIRSTNPGTFTNKGVILNNNQLPNSSELPQKTKGLGFEPNDINEENIGCYNFLISKKMRKKMRSNAITEFSIWCFLPHDSNISSLRATISGKNVWVKQEYDINYTGEWQELIVQYSGSLEKPSIYTIITINGKPKEIYFALPQIKINGIEFYK